MANGQTFYKVTTFALLACLAAAGVVGYLRWRSWEFDRTVLLNTIAQNDRTIELKDGLFQRKAQEVRDLTGLLDTSERELAALKEELERTRQDVLTLNQLVVRWRTAYEGAVHAHQDPEPQPPGTQPAPPVDPDCEAECAKVRTRVTFDRDFGYIGVSGYTVTNPPEGYVKVEQKRPLVLTLAVSQASDGSWRSTVASSEDNVAVDIRLAAVDPYVLRPRWYQRVGVVGDVHVGAGLATAAVGVTYDVGRFSFGPTVGVTTGGATAYGVSFTWRPFAR